MGKGTRLPELVVFIWRFFMGKGTRLSGLVVFIWRFFMGKGTRLSGLVVFIWRFFLILFQSLADWGFCVGLEVGLLG
jgi:hypothetical protein